MHGRRLGWIGVMALTGCIQGKLDLPDFELTDWTSDLPDTLTDVTDTIDPTLATVTLTTTEGMSVSSTSVSGTSADDTGSTGDDSTTGDRPDSACDPQPDDIETAVLVDGILGWEHAPTSLTTTCVITWIGPVGTALHLGLACADGSHTLDVSNVGDSALALGDVVELGVWIDVPWWADVYVVVRRDGEVMLAAMSAEALPGDGNDGPSAEFFAPLQVELLDDVCPIEPSVPEPCNFICSDPCTVDRRAALAFLEGDEAEVVYDRRAGRLGTTAIEVGSAMEHVEVSCADTAGAWFGFVAIRE
jgi:hypothetical protein